ncbi:Asp-tRNA(Asn)/Glu-tRNA(Gln) amidotransferase subunit GatB [Candidatus Woesearchaeota archaeon]|nr:Asp-tRNA(Asn)/Glu-tRNA(Gln) amidotransferase subunit GatB [Candidatus Woesearchaeota archaeon]USN43825.1 MAG: Asp-tRNA(Asn)/Glu-tRNA(Gln) amidotransferase subunit GatB [Candidatus Woesearchaeota archaeon]
MGNIKIGLEIHMHLRTKEKLFCTCKIPEQNSPINTTICERCTGQPGAKPMLPNKTAIAHVIKLALIFNSSITKNTYFQRKHYTWPDMPTGFQRTISGGHIAPNGIGGSFKGIELEELHIEEDPAAWDPVTGEINYNRSGFPLAEIVTKPQFTSTEQLRDWLEELILVSKYLKALNEEYGIKSDVNVSIEESDYQRVEIKNVSSITNIVKAAEAEIARQRECVSKGEPIKQETRRYNDELDETQFMRSKEDAQDYMFLPEPDLPNLIIDDKWIAELKASLPELPEQKRQRYAAYSLSKEDIEVLVANAYLTQLFEHALEQKPNPKEVGLFLRREVPRVLNYHHEDMHTLEEKNIKEELSNLLELLGSDKISYTTAQKLLEKLYDEKFDIKAYVEENNLLQVQDTALIEELLRKALREAPKAVEDFKNGNDKALNFIVGIVMRETKGTAKPQVVNEILAKVIQEF